MRLSEHQLINQLAEGGVLDKDYGRDSVALFQTHFLVMNALYQLKRDQYPQLVISALDIQLIDMTEPGVSSKALADSEYADLGDYYLDWNNFKGASKESVDQLLNVFWERYLAMDDRGWALELFGLQEPLTLADIKRRYRQLAMELHPDRGGDHEQLVELNRARDVLSKVYF
jgi:hypothetical protein